MKRDLIRLPVLESSFLSCEKDIETILRKLFIESNPWSEQLKRLLVVNVRDCLTNNSQTVKNLLKEVDLKYLFDRGYLRLTPKIPFGEHEEVKSQIIISFDNFFPNYSNPQFRDCTVMFDIVCHSDYWELGDYKLRPMKIAGIIDGLLNGSKLSGIGTLDFQAANELILDQELSGYTLLYSATHGTDDALPPEEETLTDDN